MGKISKLGVTISRNRFMTEGMQSKGSIEWKCYHVSWVILMSFYVRHKDRNRGIVVVSEEETCHYRKDKVHRHTSP